MYRTVFSDHGLSSEGKVVVVKGKERFLNALYAYVRNQKVDNAPHATCRVAKFMLMLSALTVSFCFIAAGVDHFVVFSGT